MAFLLTVTTVDGRVTLRVNDEIRQTQRYPPLALWFSVVARPLVQSRNESGRNVFIVLEFSRCCAI